MNCLIHAGLVERLHGTKRSKESTIKQQQNRNLAEQLRELKFEPTLNKTSQRMARESKRGKMVNRMKMDLEVRERKLQTKRDEKLDKEMDTLKPKPDLAGARRSKKYLEKASKPTIRTVVPPLHSNHTHDFYQEGGLPKASIIAIPTGRGHHAVRRGDQAETAAAQTDHGGAREP